MTITKINKIISSLNSLWLIKTKKMHKSNKNEFIKKWDTNLREMERKCRDLLLEKHCEKLFCLMDSFWEVIAGVNLDLNWLIKVRSHFDKIEKEQEKVKLKKLSGLSRNSSLKKREIQ